MNSSNLITRIIKGIKYTYLKTLFSQNVKFHVYLSEKIADIFISKTITYILINEFNN